jgi:hypothetical protein
LSKQDITQSKAGTPYQQQAPAYVQVLLVACWQLQQRAQESPTGESFQQWAVGATRRPPHCNVSPPSAAWKLMQLLQVQATA